MLTPLHVLVVEDNDLLRTSLTRHLRSWGHTVQTADAVERARSLLASERFDALLLDLGLPDGDGLDVLENLPASAGRPHTIVMTGDGTQRAAVSALRLGADDFLLKPFSPQAMATALERHRSRRTSSQPSPSRSIASESLERWRAQFAHEIVGSDPALLEPLSVVARVADSDASVLVLGETGTGKELVARALHRGSSRRDGPFAALNCAAMPESIIESELFGAARGAYTGAVSPREGRFVAARGGTLFLDEIAEMPLAVQAKLLRAIQEREITPVGDTRSIPIDVRFVAATHADLDALVQAHRFRADLLYRLDVIRVELPPLRQRRADVPVLVQALVQSLATRLRRPVVGVSEAALEVLSTRSWPGNVRQLENALEAAIIQSETGRIEVNDLPARVRAEPGIVAESVSLPPEGLDLKGTLERLEQTFVRQALARTAGNKTRAAELLGVNRTTLVEKLRKMGRDEPT